MFAVVIAIVCIFHAERILSAIAKFLVYLLGEGGRRSETGEGNVGEKSEGENGEGMEEREMGMPKKYPQNATHLAFWDARLGPPPRVILRKS